MPTSGSVTGGRSRGGGSGNGGDRFYHPPAVRHRLQEQQQQQQQQQKQLSSRSTSISSNSSVNSEKKSGGSDECGGKTTTNSKDLEENEKRVESKLSNLDQFLEHTTPRVQAQFIPKRGTRDRRSREGVSLPYFVLGDLWESFREWSAYGAGVPVLLNGSDSVVQYYVPYLSAIQLYIDPARPSPRLRRPAEENDIDSSRETSSDGSCDYGTEKSDWSQQNVANGNIQRLSRLSLKNGPCISSSDQSETCNSPGQLVFEYFEDGNPYHREPLADKIFFLASQHTELKTYRSCDLSPASWISVAWYPIYRIPTGPTLQNLDACFLTFHSLSTASHGTSADGPHAAVSTATSGRNVDSYKLSLHSFGLATFKFKVSFWNNVNHECQKANSLLKAADNWLKDLQVYHHDYNFFIKRNTSY